MQIYKILNNNVAVVLDENGRAKPGLETLDAFLDLMGWPKA